MYWLQLTTIINFSFILGQLYFTKTVEHVQPNLHTEPINHQFSRILFSLLLCDRAALLENHSDGDSPAIDVLQYLPILLRYFM